MNYSIENDLLKVEVNEQGAELCSIFSKSTKREYIWQANPSIWGSSAPVLFPNIGLLKGGEYTHKGKRYQLPKHGIIRNSSKIKMVSHSQSRISFLLSHDDESLKQFPFEFDFKINFMLNGNRLQVFHEIINLGAESMYFSLGGHPAFNCLWQEGEKLADYYIEFDKSETASILRLNAEGLLTKEKIPFLKDQNEIALNSTIFENDALIFTDLHSSEVTLRCKKNKTKIKMSYGDFPCLGIWSKPKAPYVCLEPWDGLPDFEDSKGDWTKKKGNRTLEPGNTYYASYQIQILEG